MKLSTLIFYIGATSLASAAPQFSEPAPVRPSFTRPGGLPSGLPTIRPPVPSISRPGPPGPPSGRPTPPTPPSGLPTPPSGFPIPSGRPSHSHPGWPSTLSVLPTPTRRPTPPSGRPSGHPTHSVPVPPQPTEDPDNGDSAQ